MIRPPIWRPKSCGQTSADTRPFLSVYKLLTIKCFPIGHWTSESSTRFPFWSRPVCCLFFSSMRRKFESGVLILLILLNDFGVRSCDVLSKSVSVCAYELKFVVSNLFAVGSISNRRLPVSNRQFPEIKLKSTVQGSLRSESDTKMQKNQMTATRDTNS